VGQDPTNIELLWQRMFRYPRWRGDHPNSAISAVEVALWDILGQALGVPIYKLLGGAARERVRLNKDVGLSLDGFLQAKAEGYTAAKSGMMGIPNRVVIPSAAVNEPVRRLQEICKAIGNDFDISFDAHGQMTTTMATDFCMRVEDLRLLFVEEPTHWKTWTSWLCCGEDEGLWPRASGPSPSTGSSSFARAIW
jgi:galactonate dehydratase